MRATLVVVLSVMFAAGLCGMVVAGSLEPTGPPTAGSGMYTLQNLYDYIVSGTALEAKTSFQEPTSGPGSTMKTTKDIGDAIKDKFNLCAATADNVEQGVTFFCTQPGNWGIQTGTLSALPRPTASPTATPTLTPTPTSTWNMAICESPQYNGRWRATQISVGDYGCWIKGEMGANSTCVKVCNAVALTCAPGQWNDSTSCDVCRDWMTGQEACITDGGPNRPIWYSNTCYYNSLPPPGRNPCTGSETTATLRQFCVCVP